MIHNSFSVDHDSKGEKCAIVLLFFFFPGKLLDIVLIKTGT